MKTTIQENSSTINNYSKMNGVIRETTSTAKIKLFILTGGFTYGGTEKFLFDLVQALNKDRFDVFLGCYRSGGPFLPKLQRPPIEIGMEKSNKFIRVPLFLYRLIRYMRLQKFDIVYATHFQTNAYLALASLMLKDTKVILGYRGLNPGLSLAGRCISFLTGRIADRVIVNSKAAGERLMKTAMVHPDRVSLIYNGVMLHNTGSDGRDSQEFLRNIPINRQNLKIIGTIGRLHKIKGHDYLLRAFASLIENYPSAILYIIGDGAERQTLECLAAELGISSKVVFTGFLPTNRKLLETMDIFVLPSLSESFPNALIEAMAAGLPCIATAVGGVTEIIEDGVDGLLVSQADSGQLKSAVQKLLNGSDQYLAGIREKAKEKAYRFTNERMVSEVETVFEEVLNKRSRKANGVSVHNK